MKWFKKIYSDRIACGVWREGDAVNYNEPADKRYTVEFIDEEEYNTIKQQVKEYYESLEKQERIEYLKKEIFVLDGANLDKTKEQTELDELEVK